MRQERIAALLVLLSMLVVGAAVAWYGRAAVPGFREPGVVVFNLTGVASDGVWTLDEVNGLNYWWKQFEPATLHLEVGDRVVVNLRSADLFHRFYIPAFAVGPVDVEPGHMATVRFTATQAGVYQYYCTSMCGGCHFYMRGWIVVSAPGEPPIDPPAILCPLCLPDLGPPPPGDDLVALGSYLYQQRGCVTCHGPEGIGGVANPNSANSPVPAHNTTAQKLFLDSPDDAEALIELVTRAPGLAELDEEPEISRFPVVRARYAERQADHPDRALFVEAGAAGPRAAAADAGLAVPGRGPRGRRAAGLLRLALSLGGGGLVNGRRSAHRDRLRRRLLALLLAAEAVAVVALAAAGSLPQRSSVDPGGADRALVIRLRLTGLALWPEASYCRQPALSDLFTPHSFHPAAPDPLPAGSIVPPHPWTAAERRAARADEGTGP